MAARPRPTAPRPALALHLVLGSKTNGSLDPVLADRAVERLLAAAVGDADRDEAVRVLRGNDTTWGKVAEATRARSLFATRRAVVVRGAEQVRKGGEESFLAALDPLDPDVTLVLVAAKVDGRLALWKKVSGLAQAHSAEPLRGRELQSEVAAALAERRLRLDAESIKAIVDHAGSDLGRLLREVEKLEAYAGGAATLSLDEVEAVLGRAAGKPLWKLSDAFAERQMAVAVGELADLVEGGEPELRILATLHGALRRVVGAAALREAGVSAEQLGFKLGLPTNQHFKVPALLRAARSWPEPAARAARAALAGADRRIKLSVEPEAALLAAVVASLRPSGRPAR